MPFGSGCCENRSQPTSVTWHPASLSSATDPKSLYVASYAVAAGTAYRFPQDLDQPLQQLKVGESLGVVVAATDSLRWRVYDATGIGAANAAGQYPLTKADGSPLVLLDEVSITQENASSVLYEHRKSGVLTGQFRTTHNAGQNYWQTENLLAGSRERVTIVTSGSGWLTTSERFERNTSGIWILIRSSSSTTATIEGREVVVQETEGGEVVASHGFYPDGSRKWTVYGDGSWKFFNYDSAIDYQVYSPYGDTAFPVNGCIPSLSAMNGIRCDFYTANNSYNEIESIQVGWRSSTVTTDESYNFTVEKSTPQGIMQTTSIKDVDFVFQGFRGRILSEDDGRGTTTLREYTRGTMDANGFTAAANGDAVMEIITKGDSAGIVPELLLYDSDYLILHPITVGAKFDNVLTREVRIYDSKNRTIGTATQILDGTSYAVATQTLRSYASMPADEGEIITEIRDGRVVSTSSSFADGTWEEIVDEAGAIRTTVRDLLGRVTTETSPGPGSGGTITRSYTYDGLTTTITTSGGGLSLSTSETRDLRGRVVSTTDETGIVTSYTYPNGGRTTTTTRPGGVTETTTRYLDGKFKERSGSGVIREFASYRIEPSGNEITKSSSGPAVSSDHGARWTETTTDTQGRIVSVRRPGPLNDPPSSRQADIVESYTYNSTTGKLRSISSSAQPGIHRLMEEDFWGTFSASGIATHTGPLVANSSDRFSSTATTYEKRSGRFWQVTTRRTYVQGATPVTTSTAVRLWTGDGEKAESTDAANVTTTQTRTYDPATKTAVTSTVNPLQGTTTETTINGFLVTRSIPGAPRDETFGYDGLGREIRRTDVRNASTHTSYNSLGQVQTVVDHLGQSATYIYYPASHASAGRLHRQTDAAGTTTETAYDLLGRVSSTSGSATYPVSQTYDGFGDRETLTTYGTQTAITTWVNDPPTGLLLEKKYHGQSDGVKYTYHADGKPASRTWRRGVKTNYAYNNFRDLSSITYFNSNNTPDPTTPAVSFSNFDRLGRPGTVTEGGNSTTLTYNPVTGEASTTYAADHSILPGLSVSMKTPNSGRPGGYTLRQGSTILDDVSYGYDSLSRLGGLTSGTHQVGYEYYPGTSILRETTHTVAGSGTPRIETRAVDLSGRTTGVVTTVPSGAGRRIAASAGYLLNSRGLREKLTREDGTSWHYGYNSRGEVTSGVKKLANGDLAAGLQFGYQFDAIGNRLSAKSGGDTSGNQQRTVSYNTPNALNQYTAITTPGSFDVLVRSPDSVGVSVNGTPAAVSTQGNFHRAEATVANPSGAWAALSITSPIGQNSITGHRWVPPATFTPSYDADGNLTNDGRWVNTWDAENRLISQTTAPLVPVAVPRTKIENTYDWQSRRIQKKVSTSTNGTSWTPPSDERFIYERWNPIAEFTRSGTSGPPVLSKTNLWGLDLSGTLQSAGGVSGLLALRLPSSVSQSSVFFPSYDANGNIIAWTATNGDTLQRIDYDPFGNVVSREGVSGFAAPAWGFSTKYQDKETGLLYYGYRFYDPVTGRWLSKDPIEESGGVNLYGMVANDVVNRWDVLGLAVSSKVDKFPDYVGYKSWQFDSEKLYFGTTSNPITDIGLRLASLYFTFVKTEFKQGEISCYCDKEKFANVKFNVTVWYVKIEVPLVVGGGTLFTFARLGKLAATAGGAVAGTAKKAIDADAKAQIICDKVFQMKGGREIPDISADIFIDRVPRTGEVDIRIKF